MAVMLCSDQRESDGGSSFGYDPCLSVSAVGLFSPEHTFTLASNIKGRATKSELDSKI